MSVLCIIEVSLKNRLYFNRVYGDFVRLFVLCLIEWYPWEEFSVSFMFIKRHIKVVEHSLQVPMSNSPLLSNYLCFDARFLQESRLTTKVFILALWLGCVLLPWQRDWLKTRRNKWFLFILKKSVVRFFSSFAHYELTLNPFCQHCSN